jgi:cobalt-zinc-cadmium efflux system membrane fusion protein
MNHKIRIQIFSITIALLFFSCGKESNEIKENHREEKHDAVTVSMRSINETGIKTEIVSLKPVTGFLKIPAKVFTNQDNEAMIGSLVQGRTHKVLVNVGDYVKAGQILMYVEGLEIGEIKANFLKAKANLDFTKADLERHKNLSEQNIGSKQSYYEAKAEYDKALAEFNAEDKKIHSIGLDDEDILNNNGNNEIHTAGTLPIKSPINGIVVERNVVIGQMVDATTTAFKVININSVWIDAQVYEKDINKLQNQSVASFTSLSYPGEKFEGKVIYIGQTVNEQTHTITIRCEVLNKGNKLKPQMFGELNIPVGNNSKAIIIPAESIYKEANSSFVFVQQNDSTFENRFVETGISIDDMIEIKEGLKEGEKIVSKGVFYLKSELKKDEIAEDEH